MPSGTDLPVSGTAVARRMTWRSRFIATLERSAIGFVLAIILAASVGGIVEIAPLFTIPGNRRRCSGPASLHAARTGRSQHLRPRRLLCLPQPDGAYATGRGGPIRTLFARGGIEIRPSDALGIKADRPRPRTDRGEVLGPLARRSPDRSTRGRSRVEHASLSPGWLATPLRDPRPSRPSRGAARARRPRHPRDDRERRQRRVRPGNARHAVCRRSEAIATGMQTQIRAFDGVATHVTEMDALVAYLQVLGHPDGRGLREHRRFRRQASGSLTA